MAEEPQSSSMISRPRLTRTWTIDDGLAFSFDVLANGHSHKCSTRRRLLDQAWKRPRRKAGEAADAASLLHSFAMLGHSTSVSNRLPLNEMLADDAAAVHHPPPARMQSSTVDPRAVGNAITLGKTLPLFAWLTLKLSPDARITSNGKTLLMLAVAAGTKEAVQALLAAGADVHLQEPVGGVTALHMAANASQSGSSSRSNISEIIALLVDAGAFVDARTSSGVTPLMMGAMAAKGGRSTMHVMDSLLAHGADPCLRSDDRRTAVDYARECKNRGAVIYLKRHEAQHQQKVGAATSSVDEGELRVQDETSLVRLTTPDATPTPHATPTMYGTLPRSSPDAEEPPEDRPEEKALVAHFAELIVKTNDEHTPDSVIGGEMEECLKMYGTCTAGQTARAEALAREQIAAARASAKATARRHARPSRDRASLW